MSFYIFISNPEIELAVVLKPDIFSTKLSVILATLSEALFITENAPLNVLTFSSMLSTTLSTLFNTLISLTHNTIKIINNMIATISKIFGKFKGNYKEDEDYE